MSNKTDMAPIEGGKSKLPLIMGLAAGLLVGGGGVAAYFLFFAGDPQAPVEEAAPAEEPQVKTSFVKIDRLSAPLVDGERVVAYVLLDLSLEIKSSSDELLIAQRMPALRDAFLRNVTEDSISRPNQPLVIDYDGLTERLRTVANRELRKDAVMRVLVTQSTRL